MTKNYNEKFVILARNWQDSLRLENSFSTRHHSL